MDTGSSPNLIKENSLELNTQIDIYDTLDLIGITTNRVATKGSVFLTIREIPVKFHVVHSDFPIKQQGILGRNFLEQP